MNEFRKLTLRVGLATVICGLLQACSHAVILRSEPSGADIFVTPDGSKDSVLLGQTPLKISAAELEKKANHSWTTQDLMEFVIKKDGYKTDRVKIPGNRIGVTEVTLYSKLEIGTLEGAVAGTALQHLMNAQKFANNKEFDRAHLEVDLSLNLIHDFPRSLSMKGTIYFLQQKYTDSLRYFEAALKQDPNLDDAVKMIAYITKKSQTAPTRIPASADKSSGGVQ